jgi:hypothetical protein
MTTLASEPETAVAIRPVRRGDIGQLVTDADGVGAMLDLSGRSVRRMNSAALMPRPIRVMGSIKWRVADISAWVAAGCPNRAEWEKMSRSS